VPRTYTSKAARRDHSQELPPPEFELDGVKFVGTGRLSALDASEFARLAASGVDSESPEGQSAIAEFFITVLGKACYQRLRAHIREHQTDDSVIMQLIGDIIEDWSNRPTSTPSASSDGQTSTPGTSTVVSFSRGTVEVTDGPTSEQEPEREQPVRVYG